MRAPTVFKIDSHEFVYDEKLDDFLPLPTSSAAFVLTPLGASCSCPLPGPCACMSSVE